MKKKPGIASVDIEAFQQAVKGTRRIQHDKVHLSKPSIKRKEPVESKLELKDQLDLTPAGSETKLSYHQSGISHKILRNLRKGQYNVEAVLDLHGMTANKASAAVDKFLRECLADKNRVVLIIHGKGRSEQPVLKNKLNHWLRGLTDVLAFCSASSAHGSRGAVYVLLRAKHED